MTDWTMTEADEVVTDDDNYVTVEDAETYFSSALDTTAWDAATDAEKAAAIVEAFKAVDRLKYRGRKAVDGQSTAWPRYFFRRVQSGVGDIPRVSLTETNGWYSAFDGEVPDVVEEAIFEEALERLNRKRLRGLDSGADLNESMRRQGIKAYKLSDLSITYDGAGEGTYRGTGLYSSIAHNMLKNAGILATSSRIL